MHLLAFDPLLPLKNVMGAILTYIYAGFESIFGSNQQYYGPTIIVFTLLVMIVLAPLTIKSTRSMIKTQRLSPKLKKLQEEYKDDRQALNEATMAMYKDEGINPMGGCLPLALQMPFFFGLFSLIGGLTNIVPKVGHPGKAAPLYIDHTSSLYNAIINHNAGEQLMRVRLPSFGLDLGISAWDAVKGATFTDFLPYVALVLLTVGLQYFQQHQITKVNPNQAASGDAVAQQMQMMTKFMPLMFGVFSFTFSTGLVLYLVTSSVFRIIQQWAMYKFDPELRDSVLATKEAHAMALGEAVAKKEHQMTARERAEAKVAAERKPTGLGALLPNLLGDRGAENNQVIDVDSVEEPASQSDRAARAAASRKSTGPRGAMVSPMEGTTGDDVSADGSTVAAWPRTHVKGGGGTTNSQAGRSARPRRQQPNKGRKGH